MRGIIIDPVLSSSHGGYLTIDDTLIKNQFRLALFFWDKIDWPTNSMIHFVESEDLALLRQENILERTKVNLSFFDGSKQIETLTNIQNYVFLKRNIESPDCWGLQRYGHSLETILSFQETHKVLELELYNAIPIPHQNVPFEKILDFKRKYSDELIAFRTSMDELYQNIINSPDQLKSKQANIQRVEESIADLHNAMKSHNMLRSLLSQRITLKLNDLSDIGDLVSRGSTAFGALTAVGADKITAAIGAVAHAAIKVGVTKRKTLPMLPPYLQAYQYISKMEQELL